MPNPDDLKAFEKSMRKFVNKKLAFTKREVSSRRSSKDLLLNPYKLAIIDDIEKSGTPIYFLRYRLVH